MTTDSWKELNKISKYDGGMEIAMSLAAKFEEMYPRHKVMIEELSEFL